jgi:hypothetical protein
MLKAKRLREEKEKSTEDLGMKETEGVTYNPKRQSFCMVYALYK